jgi:putative membrane protein
MPEAGPPSSNQFAAQRTEFASERTDLAVERTLLAHERTMMAWVRTAASLISFGFTIYKFFDYLQQDSTASLPWGWFGPREFAIAMIVVGLAALVIAILEDRRGQRALRQAGAQPRRSLALIVAVLVAGLGMVGLALAIWRQ